LNWRGSCVARAFDSRLEAGIKVELVEVHNISFSSEV